MTLRSRIWYIHSSIGDPIDWSTQLPYNATLLQWSFASNAVAQTDNVLTLQKISVVDPLYDVTIASVCPYTDNVDQYLCNPNTEFSLGDSILVQFLNDDGLSIGIQLCFTEGG